MDGGLDSNEKGFLDTEKQLDTLTMGLFNILFWHIQEWDFDKLGPKTALTFFLNKKIKRQSFESFLQELEKTLVHMAREELIEACGSRDAAIKSIRAVVAEFCLGHEFPVPKYFQISTSPEVMGTRERVKSTLPPEIIGETAA